MISYAEQKGSNVYVYNMNGGVLFTTNGELVSYTIDTVTVKRGSSIYVLGERGEVKFTK